MTAKGLKLIPFLLVINYASWYYWEVVEVSTSNWFASNTEESLDNIVVDKGEHADHDRHDLDILYEDDIKSMYFKAIDIGFLNRKGAIL